MTRSKRVRQGQDQADPSVETEIHRRVRGRRLKKDSVLEGIYEIKGDELRICTKVLGKDRPLKVQSPPGRVRADRAEAGEVEVLSGMADGVENPAVRRESSSSSYVWRTRTRRR